MYEKYKRRIAPINIPICYKYTYQSAMFILILAVS